MCAISLILLTVQQLVFLAFDDNKEPVGCLSNYHESRSEVPQLFTSRELVIFQPKQTGYLQVPVSTICFLASSNVCQIKLKETANKFFDYKSNRSLRL